MKMRFPIIFFVLFLFFSAKINAQLDLEHWFPPFLQSTKGNQAITSFHLILSTDKEEPFSVNLYNNNTLVQQFTLSKDSPVDYEITKDSFIRASTINNTMKPVNMGLHLAGEKSFYASLRMYGSSVSEMISSKGKSALGNEFFVVNDKILLYDPTAGYSDVVQSVMNYQASIMAYEDNTHVTISNFDERLVFANGDTSDELNIVLNKGQSYIVAAIKKDNPPMPNRDKPVLDDNDPNLIGAKITSDKKIIVNNGNFISQDIGVDPNFVPLSLSGNANMDQSMPVSKIGKEYFIANGLTYPNGTNPKTSALMEKMMIVATEDQTEIFLNDEISPHKTLNAGEYYLPSGSLQKFIDGNQPSFTNSESKTIPTKGMFIHANKPIYLYQLVGGFQNQIRPLSPDYTYKTSAMLFSYPIDKDYTPDPRQLLSNTLIIPQVDNLAGRAIDSKITIKTENDANVLVNGSPITNLTPIPGKNGWSYWSRYQLSGNVEISSNKSINVDYIGGYPYSGIAGSFTGYSNDPFIIKNGNCIQETVVLTLNTTDFEKIQWQRNGIDIPGANEPTYIPTEPGNYTCALSYADFTYTTSAIFVDDCPYSVSTINIGDQCPDIIIVPAFSSPNDHLTIDKVEISTPPLHGKVEYSNNVFTISPEGYSGEDRLVYKITATTGFFEIVKVEYHVLPEPIADIQTELLPNGSLDNTYYYDLPTVIHQQNNEVFTFYETINDAENETNEIADPSNYSSTEEKKIFVSVKNNLGCSVIKNFTLIIPPKPEIDFDLPNVITPNGDGYNDTWNYGILQNVELKSLNIFDKYGTLVYSHKPTNTTYSWNGKDLSNNILPTASYWVVYNYIDSNNQNKTKNQWIFLKH